MGEGWSKKRLNRQKQNMLATHISREPAGAFLLEALHLTPVITAGMALGEGTGAVAAMPLIDMALAVYRGATFDDIRVEAYKPLGDGA
jgi:nicotinate-nucleotide--dimethylbenzimidazole phosphoribosyltransferase